MDSPATLFTSIAFLNIFFTTTAAAYDFDSQISFQQRWFYEDALHSAQDNMPSSIAFEAQWYTDWNNRQDSLVFKPFYRFDSEDDERSHGDIRELFWSHISDTSELGLGINKVFWGVAESQHLVDIINQTDMVEAPDGEEKLGQLMLRWSTLRDWGNIELYILPGFRPRTFAGEKGRLRSARVVSDDERYESGAGKKHVDFAARWSHSFGLWDLGVSYFDGTSRVPLLEIRTEDAREELQAYYAQISQVGVEAQLTTDSSLWKFEAIHRKGYGQDYGAFTGGFEYTFYSVFGSAYDVGLLSEYSRDSRNDPAAGTLQDDLFIGSRLTWNNVGATELLFGITQDLQDSDSYSGKIEASSRFGAQVKVYLEAWFFQSDKPTDGYYPLRQDSFFETTLEYYF
jgi:hypothetical protein